MLVVWTIVGNYAGVFISHMAHSRPVTETTLKYEIRWHTHGPRKLHGIGLSSRHMAMSNVPTSPHGTLFQNDPSQKLP